MIALLGIPLALAVGVLADLAGDLARRAAGGPRSGGTPGDLIRALRKARTREPAGALQALGALSALLGAGVAGACVLGALPGGLPTVALSLMLTGAGARLALSDPTTRARAERAAGDRLHAVAFEALLGVALVAAFARWRAPDLEAIRGAQAVLGPGIAVGPALRAAAFGLASLAALVAGGARVPNAAAAAPGRGLSPEGALLASLARWSGLGAAALVGAALLGGPAVGSAGEWSSPVLALPIWTGAVIASAALAGLASWALGARPARIGPRLVGLGLLAIAVGGSFALGVIG